MSIPSDYLERVYAGVLGKLIGVYLGRPFEGWKHERIMSELGQIRYYVNDRLNRPLVVTDDDISGTLTFVRALGLREFQVPHRKTDRLDMAQLSGGREGCSLVGRSGQQH